MLIILHLKALITKDRGYDFKKIVNIVDNINKFDKNKDEDQKFN